MARAGTINLVDVVGYAEAAEAKGFVFMGSVFDCKPASSI
jgi:altronate dehydratase